MSMIYGFGGMRIREGRLSFDPLLPVDWTRLAFKILYRGRTLKILVEKERVRIENLDGDEVEIFLAGRKVLLGKSGSVSADLQEAFPDNDIPA